MYRNDDEFFSLQLLGGKKIFDDRFFKIKKKHLHKQRPNNITQTTRQRNGLIDEFVDVDIEDDDDDENSKNDDDDDGLCVYY